MSALSNFTLLSFTFPTCSFPLLLSCVFQSLVYSRSTGVRDMFAHSLSRRGWHHNEQICSCKVSPTEGNYGLFVGVCGARWGPHGPPIYNCYISFTCAYSKWWQMLSHCSFLSSWVKKAMLLLTHRVSLQSLKKKRNMLMYCYVFRKTDDWIMSKLWTVQLLQDIFFQSITKVWTTQLLCFSITEGKLITM